MSSDSDDSSSSTHIDLEKRKETWTQDGAHGGEEFEDELEDEDSKEDRGEHVYLKQQEVVPVYQLETALGKQITPFIDDSLYEDLTERKSCKSTLCFV